MPLGEQFYVFQIIKLNSKVSFHINFKQFGMDETARAVPPLSPAGTHSPCSSSLQGMYIGRGRQTCHRQSGS